MVMAAGSVKIEDLPDAFGVSLMTVHRDLDTLATQGLIRKTRGVATAMPSTLSEASTEFRSRQNVADKCAVANAALQMIEPGPVGHPRRLHHRAAPGQPARRAGSH